MTDNPRNHKRWLLSDSGVYMLIGNGYRITYNPSTIYTLNKQKIKDPLFKFDQDEDTEETSLYINATDSYLILEGDFRKEYQKCDTVEQCKNVFKIYEPWYRSKYSSGLDSIN